MKRKLKFLVLVVALIAIVGVGNTQEKYAVLITGDYAAEGIPVEEQWGQGAVDSPMEEFWYDTYLMWEMLLDRGYSNDNIFVLFADGQDFTKLGMWERYDGHGWHPEIIPPDGQITDYSASIANVEDVLTGLATGTGGFPQVSEDDFLFTWVFDHGGGNGNSAFFCLIDGNMWDYEFAALIDPIAAHKKVFWMQQCYSGGFADELDFDNCFSYIFSYK